MTEKHYHAAAMLFGSEDLFRAGHFLCVVNDRRAVHEEFLRKLRAEPDDALGQILFLPGDRLPGRIENQVTRIAKQLHAVSARFNYIQEIRLADPVFTRSRIDLYAVLDEYVANIRNVLREPVPVAYMVHARFAAKRVSHHRNLMHKRTHAQPGRGIVTVVQTDMLSQIEAKLIHQKNLRSASFRAPLSLRGRGGVPARRGSDAFADG